MPFQNQSCILVAWYNIAQSSKRATQHDLIHACVVLVNFHDAIRGSCQQESVVVFVYETNIIDASSLRIAIGESMQSFSLIPFPDATDNVNTVLMEEAFTYHMPSRSSIMARWGSYCWKHIFVGWIPLLKKPVLIFHGLLPAMPFNG